MACSGGRGAGCRYRTRGAVQGQSATRSMTWAAVVLMAALSLLPTPAQSESGGRTIALDAGHGGFDTGARAAGGVSEKELALAFVDRLEADMARRWRIVTTRNGDYRLAPGERAGTANRGQADLFLSIHTGASFSQQAGGMAIYTALAEPRPDSAARPPAMDGQERPVAWDGLQSRHIAQSRRLAHLLQHHLTAVGGEQQPAVTVAAVPLAVLGGADMPAVLIEIGTLTNPADAARLGDPTHLQRLSAAIIEAVTDFFHNKSPISSSDLQQ
jgi:N-acetylmuramoyl-L-alanine amidase